MIVNVRKVALLTICTLLILGSLAGAVVLYSWSRYRGISTPTDRSRALGAAFDLLYYARHYNRLPAACLHDSSGKVLSSWRFAAVMRKIHELEREPALAWPTTDVAWNSKQNSLLKSSFLNSEPSDLANYIDPTRPGGKARFAAIIGPGTAFDGKLPCSLYRETPSTPGQSAVAPPQAILSVEVRNCTKHWMQPGGDLDVRTMDHTIGRGTGNDPSDVYPDGFWVTFADGRYWYLSNDTPFDELAKFFTLESARTMVRRKALGKYVQSEALPHTTLLPPPPPEER